jgi:hypothetical protein
LCYHLCLCLPSELFPLWDHKITEQRRSLVCW